MTPLINAAADNKIEEVKALIKFRANVNATTRYVRENINEGTILLNYLQFIHSFVCFFQALVSMFYISYLIMYSYTYLTYRVALHLHIQVLEVVLKW
jgi:hypothetical protein